MNYFIMLAVFIFTIIILVKIENKVSYETEDLIHLSEACIAILFAIFSLYSLGSSFISMGEIDKLEKTKNNLEITCPYINSVYEKRECLDELNRVQNNIEEDKEMNKTFFEFLIADKIDKVENLTDKQIEECCSIKD